MQQGKVFRKIGGFKMVVIEIAVTKREYGNK